jgi:hypothetical protein
MEPRRARAAVSGWGLGRAPRASFDRLSDSDLEAGADAENDPDCHTHSSFDRLRMSGFGCDANDPTATPTHPIEGCAHSDSNISLPTPVRRGTLRA